ncbi:MAG: type II toxin-antitoxin system RelE/ParE family toxin [Microcella sp.]|nr:type II toxin-antitoxin system RelE/ParE family toxin [Microcella sp.]
MPTYLIRVSAAARSDVREALRYSALRFGPAAKVRYAALIARTLEDISANPLGAGSRERPELGDGIIARHLTSSAHASGVNDPRHIIFYRLVGVNVDVLRVLHDARDLPQHLEGEPR